MIRKCEPDTLENIIKYIKSNINGTEYIYSTFDIEDINSEDNEEELFYKDYDLKIDTSSDYMVFQKLNRANSY